MPKQKQAHLPLSSRTCKEITKLISDYVRDRLEPGLKREFERHLNICPDCVNFLNTYKKTASLSRALHLSSIPAKVRDNVLEFLRRKMRRIAVLLFCLAGQFSS